MEAKIRKYQNTLYVTGIGILVFEIWSIIRNLLVLLLVSDNWYTQYVSSVEESGFKGVYLAVLLGLLAIIVLSELAVRLYVGLNAMAVGKGKSKNSLYIFWDTAIILFQILELVLVFTTLNRDTLTVEMAVSILVELTSCYTTCDLLVAALKVKMYNKRKLQKEV